MAYGSYVIQRDLDFVIRQGEVFVIMGGSGSGKSTLLNHMVGLKQPARGDVVYDGESFWGSPPEARDGLRRRLGVSFQAGALWSSMTLAENVGLPLQTFTRLPARQINEIVSLKLALVGLAGYEEFYPSAHRFRAWFEGMSNVTIHVYPGTRHAFFNDTVPSHYDADAASISWERTISFLRQHLIE